METVYVVLFWIEGQGYDVTETKVFREYQTALNYADDRVGVIDATDYEIQHHTIN